MNEERVHEIAQILGIPAVFVTDLLEVGIIEPGQGLLTETTVERVRVSWTLHDELGVNLAGVEVALHLLAIIQRDRRDLAPPDDL